MQWLDNIVDLLSSSWFSSTIGILGLVAAILFSIDSRRRTRFTYLTKGRRLLGLPSGGLPTGISMQYHGQDITNLSRSLVIAWNDGENTIHGRDIASVDPLQLVFTGPGKVLSASVIAQVRDVCGATAEVDPTDSSKVNFHFEFLDTNDGTVIEILHTFEAKEPLLMGTIKGLPRGFKKIKIEPSPFQAMASLSHKKTNTIIFLLAFLLPSLLMFFGSSVETSIAPLSILAKYLLISEDTIKKVYGCIYLLFGIYFIRSRRRRHPSKLDIDNL